MDDNPVSRVAPAWLEHAACGLGNRSAGEGSGSPQRRNQSDSDEKASSTTQALPNGDLAIRLDRYSIPEPNTGCVLWIGGLIPAGYGMIKVGGRGKMAHRVAYELERGPIPAGLELDHLCRQRSCINPRHLEPVTRGENQRRGYSRSGINHRKTHCIRGHALAGANLYRSPDGHRHCFTCTAAAKRAYYERNRAKVIERAKAAQRGAA